VKGKLMLSASFPEVRFPHLEQVELPAVRRIRLRHPTGTPIDDTEAHVRRAVMECARFEALPKGSTVAVALGSRGISGIVRVAQSAIATLRERGFEPFVVPAMGSHGGGTAEGQVEVLAKLGMTEETLGAPIRSSMEVIDYGVTADGARCKFDRNAASADAVVVINRVKSHTTFERPIESGLVKMMAVGLGKAEGARSVHRTGPSALTDTLPALAAIALKKSPVALGIALVESAEKQLVAIEGVAPENFFEADRRLLILAKSLLARLPFDTIDALIVEQIGKDISGAGMDYAITGRADLRSIPNLSKPFISRIAILGLSAKTGGNGLGIGLADFTTQEAVSKIDLRQIYMNSITSTMVEKSRIPVVLPDDRDAVRASVATSWSADDLSTRLCIIRSTLHLDEILISDALLTEAEAAATFVDAGAPFPLAFDAAGRMTTHAYAERSA
jgi:hypothetical protein